MSRRVALIVSGLLALACSTTPRAITPAFAQRDSVLDWTVTLDADAEWQRVTTAGTLVLGTTSGVVGLDGASGKQLWRIDDLRRPNDISFYSLRGTPYGVLRIKRGLRGDIVRSLIDLTDGHELWNSSTVAMDEVRGEVYVPAMGVLLLSGKTPTGDAAIEVDPGSGGRVRSLAMSSSEVRALFESSRLFDTDSTLVVAADSRLTRYDLHSGAASWVSPELVSGDHKRCSFLPPISGQEPPKRTDERWIPPPAPMQVSKDGQRVYVVVGSALHCVRVSDGQPMWDRPQVLCGRCVQVVPVDGGVIVRTMCETLGNDELVMLDDRSGEVRWQYPAMAKGVASIFKAAMSLDIALGNALVTEDAVYVLADQHLVRVDLAGGEGSKSKASIEEDAKTSWLERADDGFLVIGHQDMEWLHPDGKRWRHVHYDGPGDEGMGLILLGIAGAMNAIGNNSTGSGSISLAAGYGEPLSVLMREYHAGSRIDSLVFMLADLDEAGVEGSALVAIQKRTGATTLRVSVPKKPKYVVDRRLGALYVIDHKKVLCRRL